jgi:hypothetical protein
MDDAPALHTPGPVAPGSDGAGIGVRRLVGVYHADGSVVGELRYWVGARLGRAHCALCDVTHGTFRARPEWKACVAALPVPFTTVHLDEREPALRDATEGRTPCVAAEGPAGWSVLVTAAEIEACAGSPEALAEVITTALGRRP